MGQMLYTTFCYENWHDMPDLGNFYGKVTSELAFVLMLSVCLVSEWEWTLIPLFENLAEC